MHRQFFLRCESFFAFVAIKKSLPCVRVALHITNRSTFGVAIVTFVRLWFFNSSILPILIRSNTTTEVVRSISSSFHKISRTTRRPSTQRCKTCFLNFSNISTQMTAQSGIATSWRCSSHKALFRQFVHDNVIFNLIF